MSTLSTERSRRISRISHYLSIFGQEVKFQIIRTRHTHIIKCLLIRKLEVMLVRKGQREGNPGLNGVSNSLSHTEKMRNFEENYNLAMREMSLFSLEI